MSAVVHVTARGANLEPKTVIDTDGAFFGKLENASGSDNWLATKKIKWAKVNQFVKKNFPVEYHDAGAIFFSYEEEVN